MYPCGTESAMTANHDKSRPPPEAMQIGEVVPPGPPVRRHEQPGARLPQDEPQFARAVAGHDGYQYRPGENRGRLRDDPFDPAGYLDRDSVAGLHTEAAEGRRAAGRPVHEVGE